MTKTCSQCESTEVEELYGELSIARGNTTVHKIVKVQFCSVCGFTQPVGIDLLDALEKIDVGYGYKTKGHGRSWIH